MIRQKTDGRMKNTVTLTAFVNRLIFSMITSYQMHSPLDDAEGTLRLLSFTEPHTVVEQPKQTVDYIPCVFERKINSIN